MAGRTLKLGIFLFLPGHHLAGWRLPGAEPGGATQLSSYVGIARAAEAADLDMLFIGDTLALPFMPHGALSRTSRAEAIDPLVLLGALAAVTTRIGLVATTTTTYTEPYLVARQFASLDHLSGGRAGWNLVTSSNQREAGNFGRAGHPGHGDRYARAEEFLCVVRKLWDSWAPDAVRHDKAGGLFFDADAIRPIDHKGPHFDVSGPATLPRSPQGHPVVVQAGSSEPGRALGARSADVIFTAHQDMDGARAFAEDMRSRAAAAGRPDGSLLVMPGLMPIIGGTRAEAAERDAQLADLVDESLGLSILGEVAGGVDLSPYDLDGPLPGDIVSNGQKSRLAMLQALSRDEGLSIRQLYGRIARARGHLTVTGTIADVADVMEAWFLAGAADGFNLMAPAFDTVFTDGLSALSRELRRRGLTQAQTDAKSLRARLGLLDGSKVPGPSVSPA